MYDGKGNYFGASYDSYAYKTYSIYTSTAAYNASLGGYHYGSVSSGITNPGYYNAYGPFSVTDDMALTSKVVGKGTQNPKVKAAIEKGRLMHKQMDYGPDVVKEKVISPGCRVDGFDFEHHIIYELKPNNP